MKLFKIVLKINNYKPLIIFLIDSLKGLKNNEFEKLSQKIEKKGYS